MPHDTCSHCAQPKDVARRDHYCADCRRAANLAYRVAKRATVNAGRRRRYQDQAHAAANRAAGRTRRRTHGPDDTFTRRVRRRAIVTRYRSKTRADYNAYARDWKRRHPASVAATKNRSKKRGARDPRPRARVLAVPASTTLPARWLVIDLDGSSSRPRYVAYQDAEEAAAWLSQNGYRRV